MPPKNFFDEPEDQANEPVRAQIVIRGKTTITLTLDRLPRRGEIIGLDVKNDEDPFAPTDKFGRIAEIVWLHDLGSAQPSLDDIRLHHDPDVDVRTELFIYADPVVLKDATNGVFE